MKPSAPDEQVIERARQGQLEAFRELFERYQTPVYNFVARMMGQEEGADDVVQEVFVRIYQKLATLREARFFTTWLFSIAKNEAIDFVRKNRRRDHDTLDEFRHSQEVSLHDRSSGSDPEKEAVHQEMDRLLQEALNEVPEIYRAAFILGVIEGYSYKEVARMLGCTENNVKSRVFRARAVMCEKLRDYF